MSAEGKVAPTRSLVARTTALVAGVVFVLGAVVVLWITEKDRVEAVEDARRVENLAEQQLLDLAADLVRTHQEIVIGLIEGADERNRQWLVDEPLGLYRDREHPERVDVDALRRALTAEIYSRSHRERDHVQIVADRLGEEARARVDRVAEDLRRGATARAQAQAAERRDALAVRLALLLGGLAVLLAFALWRSVISPLSRLRGAVSRIAAGDLATAVGPDLGRRDEIGALARDVESMRAEILAARTGLEAEVARKTADLARTLDERTVALEELSATRDNLVQAAKMASLGTLAGGLAHEFNNLLGGIRGCVESARSENENPSVAEDLDVIRRTADRGVALVKGMLDVAKPGSRELARVDLASLVEDAVRTALPAAAHRDVEVRREIAPAPPILGDAAQLHQVALNLLTNALKAVDEGEPVVIAVRPHGPAHVVLEVRDGGPGVDPALRDRIFEPFFSGKEGGTGLGLFVSYGIVDRHGGYIDVGTAPEGGARFTVVLPAAPSRAGDGSGGPPIASPPASPWTRPEPYTRAEGRPPSAP